MATFWKSSPVFAYLMIDRKTGLIKIGSSTDPSVRERTLQSEAPNIRLLCISKPGLDGRAIEKKLHLQYFRERIRGEWFALFPGDWRGFVHPTSDFLIIEGAEDEVYYLCNLGLVTEEEEAVIGIA